MKRGEAVFRRGVRDLPYATLAGAARHPERARRTTAMCRGRSRYITVSVPPAGEERAIALPLARFRREDRAAVRPGAKQPVPLPSKAVVPSATGSRFSKGGLV